MTVELHIEALRVRGLPGGAAAPFSEALRQELTRLLTDEGVPAALREGATVGNVDAGRIDAAAGQSPERIAAQVARQLYTGWST